MLLILILGAFLRLWGIGFGLPFIYHPDEHDLSYPALVASLNRMHPGWFGLPSFMIDLLGGIYLVYFSILRWMGEVPDASAFYRLYQTQPGTFHLLGRLLAVAMGIATLPAVYRLGRWGYGRTSGLLAMLFLSVAFLHVRDSHFLAVDIPLTLFCTLAVLWSLLGCCKSTGYLAWAAVAVGLAAGTKYTGVICLFPLWTAIWLTPNQSFPKRIQSLLSMTLLAGAVFALTTPYLLFDFSAFRQDVAQLFAPLESGEPIYGGGGPRWLVYLTEELPWGLGLPLELLALAGVGYALCKRYRVDRIVLSFVLPYFLLLGCWPGHWGRWILPIVPMLLVLGACFWTEAIHPRVLNRRGGAWLAPLCIALMAMVPAFRSVRSDALLAGRTDTRTLAHVWALSEPEFRSLPVFQTAFAIPQPGAASIPVEDYLDRGAAWGEDGLPALVLEDRLWKDLPQTAEGRPRWPVMPTLWELMDAGNLGQWPIRYFVLSSFYREPVYRERFREAYPELETYRAFYADLELAGRPVAVMVPWREDRAFPFHPENVYAPTVYLDRFERPGPVIQVYEIPLEEGED
jgi:hypothetical protein